MDPRLQTRPAAVILWAGFVCGVLDITAACIQHGIRGVSPVRIFQSVAAGLLGRASYQGGAATASLGLALHFTIALAWAAVFYAASRRLEWLTKHAVTAGLLYGVFVHCAMQFIVLPLSNFPRGPFNPEAFLIQLGIHMFCVGLPIALVVRRFTPCRADHTSAHRQAASNQ